MVVPFCAMGTSEPLASGPTRPARPGPVTPSRHILERACWVGGIALAVPLSAAENGGRTAPTFFRIPPAMPPEPAPPVTELLRAAQAGDPAAAERLMAVAYEQLHRLARARMAQLPPGQTLQPTALVHEAYLRLTDKTDVAWESRRHFFFAAARAMRDILVEQARRKAGPVRGGGQCR